MKKRVVFIFALFHFIAFSQDTTSVSEIVIVKTQAEFPGGNLDLIFFIDENIQIPSVVKEKNINGKCILRFMITDKGELKNVEVIQNVPDCPECDAEAIRLIQSMPNWIPATRDGIPIRTHYNIPIVFKI
ncbi:MAG: energy transducer TonB [Flavobacteriia bacterium]|nr:energy transducer TonB [Flavobacteriia bacterium]